MYIDQGLIDNHLVWVKAWHQTGEKSLPEPVMTRIANAFMHHQDSVS